MTEVSQGLLGTSWDVALPPLHRNLLSEETKFNDKDDEGEENRDFPPA